MTDRLVKMGVKPMSPKIVDKQERKKQIARAALEVFAEKGFESASISQVARAAGIGKGTVYEYFGSKEELTHEAFMAWSESLWQVASDLLKGVDDPEVRLRRYVNASMDTFLSDGQGARLLIAAFQAILTVEKSFTHHDTIREAFGGFRKVIVATLLDGVSKGVFRPEIAKDAETIAINLAAYLDGIGLHYLMGKNDFDLKDQVDAYVQELLESLRPHHSVE
jgi:AcrR family transcriptional regulator